MCELARLRDVRCLWRVAGVGEFCVVRRCLPLHEATGDAMRGDEADNMDNVDKMCGVRV
jgi:hypothetical protein